MAQEQVPVRPEDAGLPTSMRLAVGLIRIVVRESLRGGDIAQATADYPRKPFSLGSTAFEVAIGATAAWATISLWASAMGLLVGIGYYLGLFHAAIWMPFSFIVLGIALMAAATVALHSRFREEEEPCPWSRSSSWSGSRPRAGTRR